MRKRRLRKKTIFKKQHKSRPVFKIEDGVRMTNGKAIGRIDRLEKGKAVVNYGIFTTNLSVDKLELLERKK